MHVFAGFLCNICKNTKFRITDLSVTIILLETSLLTKFLISYAHFIGCF